jgi:hypothetical protein
MTDQERFQLDRVEGKIDCLAVAVAEVRTGQKDVERRVTVVEKRLNAGGVCQAHSGMVERMVAQEKTGVSWSAIVPIGLLVLTNAAVLVLTLFRVVGK